MIPVPSPSGSVRRECRRPTAFCARKPEDQQNSILILPAETFPSYNIRRFSIYTKLDLATTARACSGYRCRASVIVTGIPRVSRLPDAAIPDTVRAMSSYCIIHRAGYPSSCDVAWTRDEECRSPTHALPSIILTTLNPQSASLLAEPWYTH